MADRPYNDADLDAAITAISEPGRLRAAEDLVARAAPSLQHALDAAIHEGGWFDDAHRQAVMEAAGGEDPSARFRAVQTLIAEEVRLGMFVGVAVGFELARELSAPGNRSSSPSNESSNPGNPSPSPGDPTPGNPSSSRGKPTTQEN